jgi:ATP-binding cassette subfamily C protein/ATP-binding cassette subfamily C protein LapB
MSLAAEGTLPTAALFGQKDARDGFAIETDAAAAQTEIASLGGFKAESAFAACLLPLLEALKWRGDPRHVVEALPHFADTLDLAGLRNSMANLHYQSRRISQRFDKIDPRSLPMLFVGDDGDVFVVVSVENGVARVFDGGRKIERYLPVTAKSGSAYLFWALETRDVNVSRRLAGWFENLSGRFRGVLAQAFAVTFMMNLLSLITPLFVMTIYDTVITNGSISMLGYLAIGVILALISDFALRGLRTRSVAFLGGRIDNIVGNSVFRQILYLPAHFTERATIGSQVARLKDFESVRDFATGPMALTLLELPFSLLFIVVIAIVGGPIAFVPLALIACFAVFGFFISRTIAKAVEQSARTVAERQEFIIEALSNLRALRNTGAADLWLERYRKVSAGAAFAGYETARLAAIVNATAQFLMMLAGLATVSLGVLGVLDGAMTVGALVATMILVWRSLAPLQMVFLSLPRLAQARASMNQIDGLMRLPQERTQQKLVAQLPELSGRIGFSNVFFRYSADADPALAGINMTVEPGEVLALIGANGSGKSTILKLLLGLHSPQAGSVMIDGQDIRQLDPLELRSTIGYVPQTPEFFYGTIAQNLRLGAPTASDDTLRTAALQAGVLADIEALPEGFATRTGDSRMDQMPGSFLQRLNLARCYLKDAPILLMDEPGNALDFEADRVFGETLAGIRGDKTVLLVTHRPSHLKYADKLAVLDRGRLRLFGPVDEVRGKLPGGFV